MREILNMVLVLGLTAGVAGLALAGVREMTADRIAEQELKNVKEPAIRAIFEGLDNDPVADRVEIPLNEDETLVAFPAKQGDTLMGVALEGCGNGYGGAVCVMVGVVPDGTLAGVGITGHSETPGLGARCTEDGFRGQFVGMTYADSVGGQVDGITGATITTNAVIDAVDQATARYGEHEAEIGK